MSNKEIKYLSASKIKTLQSCSWLYWCNYHLKLPDTPNDGASRGTVCHQLFECLGNPRHKAHYNNIIKAGTIWKNKSISRYIKTLSKKLSVDDEENIQLIEQMILNGLRYDFFGSETSKPSEGISEKDFAISESKGDINYSIRGFIDKLFLYKSKSTALIRDFKTSKKVFSGKDITDNLQALMYSLAVKKMYPNIKNTTAEFLFLKFNLDSDMLGKRGEGVISINSISNEELKGFEYFLTEIQSAVNSFSEKDARSNFAAKQNFPSDGSFGGPLSCGFAKRKNQLKKDGTKMWHCSYKFAFKYWKLEDKNGKIIKTAFEKEDLISSQNEGQKISQQQYDGCPHWVKKQDEFDL
jgi:hypothetical protein